MKMNESKTSQCPPETSLRSFLADKLQGHDAKSTEDHLSICTRCQSRLESLSAIETMWVEARNLLCDDDSGALSSRYQSELDDDYLKSILGPTDNPQMMGRIGAYEVSGVIGYGGTGVVLKAFDAKLNRFVAIKVLAPSFANNASARVRFEREGKAVAAVSNDHVVPVHAVDEYRGLPYIVMQYVAGKSLQQRIDLQGPLQVKESIRIGIQVAQALVCAHAQGIIHRDIKPANILLENGVERVRVTDFGLAQVADDASMTRSGVVAGTPQYMSPEQTRGETLDGRSDLFSLGSVMYAMCTGHSPFRADTVVGVLHRITKGNVRFVREINPDIPDWLALFIHKLLNQSPDERFKDAAEVAKCLSNELAYLQQPSRETMPIRDWIPKRERSQFRWWRSATTMWLASCLLVACVAGAFIWHSPKENGQQTKKERTSSAMSTPPQADAPLDESVVAKYSTIANAIKHFNIDDEIDKDLTSLIRESTNVAHQAESYLENPIPVVQPSQDLGE